MCCPERRFSRHFVKSYPVFGIIGSRACCGIWIVLTAVDGWEGGEQGTWILHGRLRRSYFCHGNLAAAPPPPSPHGNLLLSSVNAFLLCISGYVKKKRENKTKWITSNPLKFFDCLIFNKTVYDRYCKQLSIFYICVNKWLTGPPCLCQIQIVCRDPFYNKLVLKYCNDLWRIGN